MEHKKPGDYILFKINNQEFLGFINDIINNQYEILYGEHYQLKIYKEIKK